MSCGVAVGVRLGVKCAPLVNWRSLLSFPCNFLALRGLPIRSDSCTSLRHEAGRRRFLRALRVVHASSIVVTVNPVPMDSPFPLGSLDAGTPTDKTHSNQRCK